MISRPEDTAYFVKRQIYQQQSETKSGSNPFQLLLDLAERGLQPSDHFVWIGIGMAPPKRNSLSIDTNRLPTDYECNSVAGLDIILIYYGFATKYGTLARLCGSIYQARPRRFQIIDLDYKKIAFLKLGARQ